VLATRPNQPSLRDWRPFATLPGVETPGYFHGVPSGLENARPRGFTLIEMVISGALMSIILASAYVCLSAGFSTQRLVDARSDAAQSARVALSLMAADLRCAVPLSKEFEFIGMHRELEGDNADNLDFATRNYVPQKS